MSIIMRYYELKIASTIAHIQPERVCDTVWCLIWLLWTMVVVVWAVVVVTTSANKDPLQVYAACPFTGSTNSAARYAPNLRVPNLQFLQFSQ